MKPEEFSRKVKEKYPQYNDVDDMELARSIVQKYPSYAKEVDFGLADRKQDDGFISETAGDVKETFKGIASDFSDRQEKVGESKSAFKSGEQGFLRSAFQTLGQSAGVVSDTIGRGVVGVGKALLPQKAEDKIGETFQAGVGKVVETDPVQDLVQKYEGLKETNPALARDIDAALNIGLLATDVATAGVGGRGVNAASKGVNKAIDAAETGAGKTLKGTGKIAAELEGALTGTSAETLQQAFEASYRGGKEADKFTEALRGNVTPENLVNNVRDSIDTVQATNTRMYSEALEPIVNKTVDTSKAKTRVTNKLKDFNIKVTDDGLDFSESKFRTVPNAQTKIQQAYDEVLTLGDTSTLGAVDTTRQALRELTLVGEDGSSRSANSLIEEAIGSVRDSGKQVDGYEKLLSEFGENAEFLNEIKRSLSAGDKQTIDTAYRKLATSLKTNNERRMNLIRELDEATGGFILSDVAGQQLSETLPRGLFRQIGAGMAGAGVVTGGLSTSLIVPMVFASPRVAGEVIRSLGLSAQKTKIMIDAVDSARKTLDDANIQLPVASPVSETEQEEELSD